MYQLKIDVAKNAFKVVYSARCYSMYLGSPLFWPQNLPYIWSAIVFSIQAQTSLAQLFIKFLESESSTHTSIAVPVSGYIDPHTDPDKPSLATAALPDKPSLATAALPDKPSLGPLVDTNTTVQSHDQNLSLGTHMGRTVQSSPSTEHSLEKPVANTTSILNQSSLLKSVLAD